VQQQLADNRVRWVNQQELHRPDSRRRSRRTPEASRSRENPRDFGQPARLQWAAECENYPGGWARSKADHLGDIQFASETAKFRGESIEFPSQTRCDAAPLRNGSDTE